MIIDLRIGRTSYKVNCHEGEKEKILELADRLDSRVSNLSYDIKNADDQTLLLIVALMLEEEVANAKDEGVLGDKNGDEIYEALSETINNIADHIERLIERIEQQDFN